MRRMTAAIVWLGISNGITQAATLAPRVLVLVNDRMPAEAGTGGTGASVFVGQYYARQRSIPDNNILHVQASTDEFVSYDDYQAQIETPVRRFLDANGGAMRKQIVYIVPIYGIPVKTRTADGQTLAVDSALSGMYPTPATVIRFANPYSAATGTRPPHFDVWADQRETTGVWKMFIVSRLDGPSAVIARGLVDKAIAAEPALNLKSGSGYFDYQGTRSPSEWQYAVDEDMRKGADLSKSKGFSTVLHTQRDSACGAMIHPGSAYYYDASAKNLYVASYGVETAATRSFASLTEGDIVVGVRGSTNNTGNFAYVTLATADAKGYIKLTYPLAPFTQYNATDQIVLEKMAGGASSKVTVPVDMSMQEVINGVKEFRFHVENGLISVMRNGAPLISLTDTKAMPLNLVNVSAGSLCWDYVLTGIQVSDKSGAMLLNENFASNSAASYQWSLTPLQGQNALWAWGWYGTAFDAYRFVPGAVGAQLTSYTAGTIRKPLNPDPTVASLADRRWGANWVPRMLEEGVTGTWGAVDEPFANFYASGTNFFDHFWSGYNFGESFYIAENVLRWTMVAIGDPLYAPAVFQKAGMRVVNTASYQEGAIAPGELVTIFGSGLGPAGGAAGVIRDGVLDRQAAGTRVLFDSSPAPLLYASDQQVNAIVPYSIAGQAATQLRVEVNGVPTDPLQLPVTASAPGLLSADASGTGQGAILNQDYSFNSPANPAARGSTVMLFGTGEGQTDLPATEGTITDGVRRISGPVSVSIGGVEGPAQFAGAAPGQLAGVFQVNAVVPENIQPGAAVPVVVRISGNASQAAITLAVQ
ncbi:MAG: hypothetical protein C5B51_12995 [Terriglobia bacterium]|nr:MAG: hypothetical protein C5B51_12995 [Terriglobia bacterium]